MAKTKETATDSKHKKKHHSSDAMDKKKHHTSDSKDKKKHHTSDSKIKQEHKDKHHTSENAKLSKTNGVKKSKKSKKSKKLEITEDSALGKAVNAVLEASKRGETSESATVHKPVNAATMAMLKASEKLFGDKDDEIKASILKAVTSRGYLTQAALVSTVRDLLEKVQTNPPNFVPFASPMVKRSKELYVLSVLIEAERNRAVKRGVKEVVKEVNRLPETGFDNQSATVHVPHVVVIAADIWPMDVITHIPLLCESRSVDYIFVRSRILLGLCGNTKRPTSVVLISKARKAPKPPKITDHDTKEEPEKDQNDQNDQKGKGKQDLKGKKWEKNEAGDDEESEQKWQTQFDGLAKLARKLRGKIQVPA